jgi:hypothetical protein
VWLQHLLAHASLPLPPLLAPILEQCAQLCLQHTSS